MENYHLSKHTASWKELMINRLSNLINCNRSAAKISQVLCSNLHTPGSHQSSLLNGSHWVSCEFVTKNDKNGVDDEGQHQVLTKVRCCRGKTFSLIPQIPLHLLSRSKVSLFYHHHLNHPHHQCYRPRHHYCHRYHLRRCRCCHHRHHCLIKWNILRKWVSTLQYKRMITIFVVDSHIAWH